MKCDSCGRRIEETFLRKVIGTQIKDSKGKKHYICNDCQKLGKEEILKKL